MSDDSGTAGADLARIIERHAIVLYDGECAFCSRWVWFVLDRDRGDRLRVAPLQSGVGGELLGSVGLEGERSTMVLIDGGRAYVRSGAVLRVVAGCGGVWRLAAVLLLVPRALRDGCYRLFAANRGWFGGSGACRVPGPEERRRFLGGMPGG